MTERPRSIVWFEWLMYLSVISGTAFGAVHDSGPYLVKHSVASYAIILVILVGLYALAIWSIARRRKGWVRWLLVALFVFGLPKSVQHYTLVYRTDLAASIAYAINYLMMGLALYFTFTAEARDWFRKRQQIDPAVFD